MSARPRIDQMVAGFAEGDAISHEAVRLRKIFRDMGFESEIYAPPEHVSPDVAETCRPLPGYTGTAPDILLNHYAIASPATDHFLAAKARKIVLYHNITPAEFFEGFDDALVRDLTQARKELKAVADQCQAVWAVSRFNAAELEALGVREVKAFPLLFDSTRLDIPADPLILKKFRTRMTNILFVGRMAPNKCIEELVQAFAWYGETMNPFSRLILVGSDRSAPRYYAMLRMLVAELELNNVCFELFASQEGLVAYYELADVFVTPSRHEGYCLPLVEAMHKGIPVIARDTGGMPEALGGAGVRYNDMDPVELAELIHRVVADTSLREEILLSQKNRLADIARRDVPTELNSLLAPLLQ